VGRFGDTEIEYLRGQTGGAGRLFDDDFPAWLRQRHLRRYLLKAVLEGRVVHANVPLTVVQGPLASTILRPPS
jgi:nicotinate phosphoribosyltransferase